MMSLRSDAVLVPYLREHGPSTQADVPVGYSTIQNNRVRGHVSVFHPSPSHGHRTVKRGKTVSILYLTHEHEPGEVIEAWLLANSSYLRPEARRSLYRIIGGYGSRWVDAISEAIERAR